MVLVVQVVVVVVVVVLVLDVVVVVVVVQVVLLVLVVKVVVAGVVGGGVGTEASWLCRPAKQHQCIALHKQRHVVAFRVGAREMNFHACACLRACVPCVVSWARARARVRGVGAL